MEDMTASQMERSSIEGARLEQKKTQIFGRRDFVMDFIAICVVLGFFTMAFVIAFPPRNNSDHDVLNMLIGQLSAGFIAVLSFFFGNIRKP
jgi:hypothetical protein